MAPSRKHIKSSSAFYSCFATAKKCLTFNLMLGYIRDLIFSGKTLESIYKIRHFSCFCLLLWNSQRLERLRQLNSRAATSRLLSGSDEAGKGRGEWTLSNKVAALLLWSVKKKRKKIGEDEKSKESVKVRGTPNCSASPLCWKAEIKRSLPIKLKPLQIKRTWHHDRL